MSVLLSSQLEEARRVIASYQQIESILRLEVESARAEFTGDRSSSPLAVERYQVALKRFNAFVIRREVPRDLDSLTR